MSVRAVSLFAVLILCASGVRAQQGEGRDNSIGEVALSNDTLQLRYSTGGRLVGVEESRFNAAFFLSEERDIVLSAALMFPTNLDLGFVRDRLSLHIGPQVYAALLDEENNDILAASIGAEVRFLLIRDMGLALAGHAYYAPDILTFGSADNLTDLMARIEIGVGSQVIAFGGMRWFEFDLTEGLGEQTLQEEVFVGFGYRF
ncbi:MAG TPA: YfaZ family outer membrane protein [Steroidobacteraceae bacterium]|jgi:hypothetical protein